MKEHRVIGIDLDELELGYDIGASVYPNEGVGGRRLSDDVTKIRDEEIAQLAAGGANSQKIAKAVESGNTYIARKLRQEEITARVQSIVGERLKRIGASADRTKLELARVAFFDIRRLFDGNGQLIPVHQLDDDTAGGISQITIEVKKDKNGNATDTHVVKIKAAPKMDALNTLSKHYKVIGDADEGVSALANALADRLNSAKRRSMEAVEDAVEVPIRRIVDSSDDAK